MHVHFQGKQIFYFHFYLPFQCRKILKGTPFSEGLSHSRKPNRRHKAVMVKQHGGKPTKLKMG